ncbi:HET domain containing protein [Pyrenophora tritici-repentis]|nr:HET domain containing protein [Pyrenophora tritici-repentis]
MNKVYRNFTLTLAASGSEDTTQGLYFPRDHSLITPLPLCPPFRNFSWHNNRHQQATHTPAPPTWHLLHDHFFGDILQDTPIFRRAWVFQERLLSPRIIHFGKEQLFWECHTSNACETFPDGLRNCLTAPSRFLQKHAYERLQSGTITPQSKVNVSSE